MSRSPVLGFNHNLRHGGCIFHIQTEDGGLPAARIDSHVFLDGRILHTRKLEYAADLPADAVRMLMKRQHKAVLLLVREGQLDALAPAGTVAATPPAGIPAVPEPPSLSTVPGPWQRLAAHLQRAKTQPPATVLRVRFSTRDAFLHAYFQGSRADGLFIETPDEVALGAIVGLEVLVEGVESRHFSLRGKVIWRRHRSGGGLRRGVGVEFLQQDAAMKERLLAFMQPQLRELDEEGPRWVGHPLHAAVRGRTGSLGNFDVLEVHAGGATVRASVPLTVGDEVSVAIRRGRLTTGFSTRALVVWSESGAHPTAGLEFLHEREESVVRIRSLLGEWQSQSESARPQQAA